MRIYELFPAKIGLKQLNKGLSPVAALRSFIMGISFCVPAREKLIPRILKKLS